MAITEVKPNEYGFARKYKDVQQINHTNGTTRTLSYKELVVVADANNNCFIGFVAEIDGIAASATGKIDLMEGDVITTTQRADADTFVAGDSNVYIVIQDNAGAAAIRQASATGRYPLKALIVSTVNGASGRIALRMPTQDGNIVAV